VSSVLYGLYAVLYLFLLAWGGRLWRAARRLSTAIFLAVTFGVFYDNLILALGTLFGTGDLLESVWKLPILTQRRRDVEIRRAIPKEMQAILCASSASLRLCVKVREFPNSLLWALSLPRFVLHQLVLPWLMLAMIDLARQAGQGWAQRRGAFWGGVILSALVMLAGVATRLAPLTLEPAVMDGVVRYVANEVNGPPLATIVSIGFTGVVGIAFWRSSGWPWIALAVALAFLGESIPDEAWRRVIGSACEVALMSVLFLTQQRVEQGSEKSAESIRRLS
jgi:hypothetical protein